MRYLNPSWVAPVALMFALAFVVVIGGIYYYADLWFNEEDK